MYIWKNKKDTERYITLDTSNTYSWRRKLEFASLKVAGIRDPLQDYCFWSFVCISNFAAWCNKAVYNNRQCWQAFKDAALNTTTIKKNDNLKNCVPHFGKFGQIEMQTWVPSTANEVKRDLSLSLNVKSSSDITSLTPPPGCDRCGSVTWEIYSHPTIMCHLRVISILNSGCPPQFPPAAIVV